MSDGSERSKIDTIRYINETADKILRLTDSVHQIEECAALLVGSLRAGNKIIFCGNGGSAAQSQHLAAELSGRFLLDREGLPGISLTCDTSAITAISNDYGYEYVYARQLSALGVRGDVLFCISTSGNSANLVEAIKKADTLGITSVALIGPNDCEMLKVADLSVRCQAEGTNFIQEQQFVVGHIICALVEQEIFG